MSYSKSLLLLLFGYIFWIIGTSFYFIKGDSYIFTGTMLVGGLLFLLEQKLTDYERNIKNDYKEIIPLLIVLLLYFLPIPILVKVILTVLLYSISFLFSIKRVRV